MKYTDSDIKRMTDDAASESQAVLLNMMMEMNSEKSMEILDALFKNEKAVDSYVQVLIAIAYVSFIGSEGKPSDQTNQLISTARLVKWFQRFHNKIE